MLVRPSYVLGGRAMVIAYDEDSVVRYMKEAVEYSQERPVLIDHFLEDATEVDVDALSDGEDVVIAGIMEHIEEAGIHSGDSSCVLPAVDHPSAVARYHARLHLQAGARAEGDRADEHAVRHSSANGRYEVASYVLEVNPRASRTVPYVSKATGVPLAKIAARLMTGRKLREFLPENIERGTDLDTGSCYFVKSPVFPWNKFPGVDTVLGPEMRSTGEVMGVGRQLRRSLRQSAARRRTEVCRPQGTRLHQRERPRQQACRSGRSPVCRDGLQPGRHRRHRRPHRRRRPERGARLQSERRASQRGRSHQGRAHSAHHQHADGPEPWFDEKAIRRAAVTARIPTITTLAAARAAAEGIAALQRGEVSVKALQHLHAERGAGAGRLAG